MPDSRDFTKERMTEYAERLSRETRFHTAAQFKEFCKNNHVYYSEGFGATIQALVRTDEEFIDFMLKCCTIDHGGNFPWFVNDYDHENLDNHLYFANPTLVQGEGTDDFEIGEVMMPTIPITAYCAEYNPYYDDPFEVARVDDFMVYPTGTFRVNPETSKKFPAVVRFVSVDTFDRMGTIKGNDLTIISLAEIEDGQMMFL